jgi:predicted nuclease of predicted toxin-antitoxin system
MKRTSVLIDESVPRAVQRVLQVAGLDAKRIQELGPRGITNSAVLRLASATGRLLVTRDADFVRLSQPAHRGTKILYLQAYPDEPERAAAHVRAHLGECLRRLQECNVVVLTAKGGECL